MSDPFASLWNRASKVLDQGVDRVVGDRLRYRHNGIWLGEGDPPVVEGFAFAVGSSSPDGYTEIDEPLASRPRVKISQSLVDRPKQSDRIQHPTLGPGWFMPSGSQPENDGRYWLFDVQGCAAP